MTMLIRAIRTALLAVIVYGATTWTIVPAMTTRNRTILIIAICSLHIIFGYLGLDLVKSWKPEWFESEHKEPAPAPAPKSKSKSKLQTATVDGSSDTASMSTEVAEAIWLLNLSPPDSDLEDVKKASGEAEQGPSPAPEPEGFSSW